MGVEVRRLLQSFGFLVLVSCSSTSVNNPENGGAGGTSAKGGTGGATGGTGGATGGTGGATGGTGGATGGTGGSAASGGAGGTTGGTSGTGAMGGVGAGGGAAGAGGVAGSGGGTGYLGQAIKWNQDCSTSANSIAAIEFGGSGEAFTVEFWYRIDALTGGNNQRLLGIYGSVNSSGWRVELASTGSGYQFMFCTSNGSVVCDMAPQTLLLNGLYHLAVSHDGAGNDTFYVLQSGEPNHAPYISTQPLPATWTPAADTSFELSSCSSGHAAGTMDGLMIWHEARAVTDLDNDAKSAQPCSAPGLVASFNFEDLSGNAVRDCTAGSIKQNINGTNYLQVDSPFD